MALSGVWTAGGKWTIMAFVGLSCAHSHGQGDLFATSALAGLLDLGPLRTGMLDSVRFTPHVS
jgi:hypothetical protein